MLNDQYKWWRLEESWTSGNLKNYNNKRLMLNIFQNDDGNSQRRLQEKKIISENCILNFYYRQC